MKIVIAKGGVQTLLSQNWPEKVVRHREISCSEVQVSEIAFGIYLLGDGSVVGVK